MADSHITRADLRALSDDLKAYIRERGDDADRRTVERFGSVNARLDKVNGRLDRHEDAIAAAVGERAEHETKIKNLEREVFGARQRVATQDDEKPALTKGGLKRALAVLAALGVAMEALHQIANVVIAALRHKP
jgi:hypothetical protein